MILLLRRRNQDGPNEVFPALFTVELFVDVLKELMYLLFGPDIFTLIVRYDVEALAERFLDAVSVVFNFRHKSPRKLGTVADPTAVCNNRRQLSGRRPFRRRNKGSGSPRPSCRRPGNSR